MVEERFKSICDPVVDVGEVGINDRPCASIQEGGESVHPFQHHASVVPVVGDVTMKNVGSVIVETITISHRKENVGHRCGLIDLRNLGCFLGKDSANSRNQGNACGVGTRQWSP